MNPDEDYMDPARDYEELERRRAARRAAAARNEPAGATQSAAEDRDGMEVPEESEADDGLPFRTLAELVAFATDARPDRWVVKHYIAPGAKTLCSSLPKVGKSTTGFGMVKAVRRGEDFAGLETAGNVGVLYLTEETSVRALEVKAAAIDLDITDPGALFVRRVEVFGMPWPEVVEYLRQRAAAFKAAGGFDLILVVVDTLGKWAGFEEGQEQDSGTTRHAIELLDPLAGDGHAILIFTHSGWTAKRSRGSSAIPGEVDVVLHLEGEPGSDSPRSIRYIGGRLDDGETPHTWSLALGDDGLTSYGEAGPKVAVKLLHVLDVVGARDTPTSSAELAKLIGVTDRTARRYLNQLVASGELERHDDIGGAGRGGRSTTYAVPNGQEGPNGQPNGQEAVKNPVRSETPSDQGFPTDPRTDIPNGQAIEADLAVRSGRTDKGPGGPVSAGSCLRCERYGIGHSGDHVADWREER